MRPVAPAARGARFPPAEGPGGRDEEEI